jgi:hypothetical protein
MLLRSWFAIFLLANYLWVVGAGCVNRPNDQHELLMIQTTQEGGHYQQCRYLRMDGLESFLTESLASRYQNAPQHPPKHLISVLNGIDSHDVLPSYWFLPVSVVYRVVSTPIPYLPVVATGVRREVDNPPWCI